MFAGVSLSCVELPELLTASDNTSNDFVLVFPGQASESHFVAEEVETHAIGRSFAESRISNSLFLPAAFVQSGRELLTFCSVQKK